MAEGKKRAQVLASEASMMERKNLALGEAAAIEAKAEASARATRVLAEAIRADGGGAHSGSQPMACVLAGCTANGATGDRRWCRAD